MPVFQGQGQSDATEAKQRGLAAAFTVNLRVFRGAFGDKPHLRYFHFDLNSGGGFNEEAGCIGSPLAFLAATRQAGVPRFFAGFVDINGERVTQLMGLPEMQDGRCYVFHGDNAGFVDAIPEIIKEHKEDPAMALGSVLCDPNGTQVPIAKLTRLAQVCPRLDLFVNWNSTGFKRQQGACGTLKETLASIPKKYWVIRHPLGVHQWTLLVGRNYPVGDHRSLGFHHLEAPTGQAILARCHYSRVELETLALATQQELFA